MLLPDQLGKAPGAPLTGKNLILRHDIEKTGKGKRYCSLTAVRLLSGGLDSWKFPAFRCHAGPEAIRAIRATQAIRQ
jgi:hypothetical protein